MSLLSIGLCLSASVADAQSINTNWKAELNTHLEEFLKCGDAGEAKGCSGYAGKALKSVYKINDFYSQQSGRYMTFREISDFLKETGNWTSLGKPYDQKILETAQEYANSKKAVVAIYENSQGIGHVVVITPGQLQTSGSWGLRVPSAASFLTSEPQKSFIDKALSFAFAKNMIKDVTIYGKVY